MQVLLVAALAASVAAQAVLPSTTAVAPATTEAPIYGKDETSTTAVTVSTVVYGGPSDGCDAANPTACGDYCVPAGVSCCGTGALYGSTYCPKGSTCVGTSQCSVDGSYSVLPNTYSAVGKKSTQIKVISGASSKVASGFAVAALFGAAVML
ncbi:hypothetical protein HDU96_000202 [Phlyctochytrium bullatum]|nr:hypothetical protein HDU96_000202 [Phlyctochytrium bullatum]